MKLIKVGISSLNGELYREYDKAKSCHLCKHFQGYGLHAFAGKCLLKDKELEAYCCENNYDKTAKECDSFDCKKELLAELLEY